MDCPYSLELEVVSLKLPSLSDMSKVKCNFTVNNYTQCLPYPFKTMVVPKINNHSVLEISITHYNQIIAGLEIPLTLFRSNKQQTFKLIDHTEIQDKRKITTKGKNENMEISLFIKHIPENQSSNDYKTEIKTLENKVKDSEILLEEGFRTRRGMQNNFEEVTKNLAKMIKSQEETINNLVSEKEKIYLYLKSVENDFLAEKTKNENFENVQIYKTVDANFKNKERINDMGRRKSYENSPMIVKRGSEKDNGQEVVLLKKKIQVIEGENEELRRRNENLIKELGIVKNRYEDGDFRASEMTLGTSNDRYASEKTQSSESLVLSLRGELVRMASKYKTRISKLAESRNNLIQENKDLLQTTQTLNQLLTEKDLEITRLQEELLYFQTTDSYQEPSFSKPNPHKLLGKYANNIKKVENQLVKSPRLGKENESSTWTPTTPEPIRKKSPDFKNHSPKNTKTLSPKKTIPSSIDLALSNFYHLQNSPLPINFIKDNESECVYHFGSKKVYIKLENSKLYVRIGGGFMVIDEFIKVYMPQEVEKSLQKNEKVKAYEQSPFKKLERCQNSYTDFVSCVGVQRRSASVNRFQPQLKYSS